MTVSEQYTNPPAVGTQAGEGGIECVFSFVVPVHNEQEVLDEFYGRLKSVADALGEPYEIIFVNDGSDDATDEMLENLSAQDPAVRVVEFSRNFGHQLAVSAGYEYALGKAVISLDGDCQHPPEMIPRLVEKWRQGNEVVYTYRKNTRGISAARRGTGRMMYRLIRFATGADLTDRADFRLLDRKALDAVNASAERDRFVRALVNWVGFKQDGVAYVAEKRAAGRSSYSLKQLARMSSAGIFNYSVKPARIAFVLGGIFLATATIYAVISLLLWPAGVWASPWWHVLMFAVAVFGLQFVMLGIIGEYAGRTLLQVASRPTYVVRRTLGFKPEPPRVGEGEHPPQSAQGAPPINIYT